MQKDLWKDTVWINCFSILSQSKIQAYSARTEEEKEGRQFIVLDEYDQLESCLSSKSFRTKFKEYLKNVEDEFRS